MTEINGLPVHLTNHLAKKSNLSLHDSQNGRLDLECLKLRLNLNFARPVPVLPSRDSKARPLAELAEIRFSPLNNHQIPLLELGQTFPIDILEIDSQMSPPVTGKNLRTLDRLPIGERGRIREILGVDGLACRLMEMGILDGEEIETLGKAPLGDPIEFLIRGYRLSLRINEAQRVVLES